MTEVTKVDRIQEKKDSQRGRQQELGVMKWEKRKKKNKNKTGMGLGKRGGQRHRESRYMTL